MAIICGASLAATFWMLCDSVKQVKNQILMSKPQLGDIKSTLDSLQPLIKEMEECEKELDGPGEELENLRVKMEEGVELIQECSKAGSFKKYKYGSKLVELSKSLKRLLGILNVQGIRDVKKALVSVRNIENQVEQIEGKCLIHNNQSEKIAGWCAVPEHPTITVGLDVPLRELKMKLFTDGVSMVILTAPGGCGKTTLATKLCQDAEIKDKFKSNVFFVTVSKKPNLFLIVQELYHRAGAKVPELQSEVTAVSWLQQFLKQTGQNPMLLVLDDVWAGSEFILEKFDEFKMTNYKILVTSRSAFPRFGSPYYLECLNNADAMALFHHVASLGDRSSYISEDLSRKIVERCMGFPLAITVVGRSLCGQPTEIWQKRVMEWSKGSSVLETEHDLCNCLQSSLDDLNEEKPLLGECFIDLGLFPEDKRIPAAVLIDMWAELYGIHEDISSIVNLYELTSRSLANLVVTSRKDNKYSDGYYSEHFVTQHDMLRELAIQQMIQKPLQLRKRLMIDICGDNLPMWWKDQKYQYLIARLVSISTDKEFSSIWKNLELPEAEVLILNFQTKYYALPEFVEKMNKLKTLILTSYRTSPTELNNFQLANSIPSLKRIRLERISIPSISRYPIQLKSLKKISLFMCSIGQGFGNGSMDMSEAFPNLVEMNIDYCNDLVELPPKLCDLIQLKKLSVTNSHKLSALPEDIGNLVNLELLRLRCCTDLSELPGSIRNLKKLNLLDISDCFSIKELPEDIGELCSLERLNMRQCSRLNELPRTVVDLEKLKEVTCDEETEVLWEPYLPFLKSIQLKVVKEDINLNWLQKAHC
ncbi:probable disease resistance protein At5g66900 isoform X2 [Argentina anserina]|uniref:probable disease resistance protein At5g66900 isoform X2 n=1 Tax=Argentina anserina TaxID=57926 RepID=UPI0021767446|nr:probable disease resistance protein At5g66900 isoform X2 [Potentilla anserina]